MIGSVFSAVSVFAIFDGVDVEGIGVVFGEADAVVADAQAELGRSLPWSFFTLPLPCSARR
jgi:hypothetical protein